MMNDPLPASTNSARRATGLCAFALACALTASACDDAGPIDAVERFVEVLPDDMSFALDVPGEDDIVTAGASLTIIEAPLIGDPSALRVLTGGVRRYLWTLITGLTSGIDRMTEGRPTSRSADRAVWHRRFIADQQERALVMRKLDHHFEFSLWVRPLGASVGQWRFLTYGSITPSRDDLGRGVMWVDLDADRDPRSHGKMSILWSIVGERRQIEVKVFDGTPNDSEIGRLTRSFRYEDGPDGGLLAFDAGELDIHRSPARLGNERVRVFTRWNAGRMVRADYSAIGPEVREDGFRMLIGSECWRPPEATISYEARVGVPLSGRPFTPLFERGERSTCAFAAEEPPIIALPGTAPMEPPKPLELDD